MRKVSIVFFCFFAPELFADPVPENYKPYIERFTSLVAEGNVSALAEIIQYPLSRKYPIPAILDKEGFIAAYSSVFDKELRRNIIESSIDDWLSVTNYCFLPREGIWINAEGKVTYINYESRYEKGQLKDFIRNEREILHSSLKKYIRPVLMFRTKDYLVRVDLTKSRYRLALWSSECGIDSKPDIIIYEGRSGQHKSYGFRNPTYDFTITQNELSPDGTTERTLYIQKNRVFIEKQESIRN